MVLVKGLVFRFTKIKHKLLGNFFDRISRRRQKIYDTGRCFRFTHDTIYIYKSFYEKAGLLKNYNKYIIFMLLSCLLRYHNLKLYILCLITA